MAPATPAVCWWQPPPRLWVLSRHPSPRLRRRQLPLPPHRPCHPHPHTAPHPHPPHQGHPPPLAEPGCCQCCPPPDPPMPLPTLTHRQCHLLCCHHPRFQPHPADDGLQRFSAFCCWPLSPVQTTQQQVEAVPGLEPAPCHQPPWRHCQRPHPHCRHAGPVASGPPGRAASALQAGSLLHRVLCGQVVRLVRVEPPVAAVAARAARPGSCGRRGPPGWPRTCSAGCRF